MSATSLNQAWCPSLTKYIPFATSLVKEGEIEPNRTLIIERIKAVVALFIAAVIATVFLPPLGVLFETVGALLCSVMTIEFLLAFRTASKNCVEHFVQKEHPSLAAIWTIRRSFCLTKKVIQAGGDLNKTTETGYGLWDDTRLNRHYYHFLLENGYRV